MILEKIIDKDIVQVLFEYRETAHNVYKHFTVLRNGNKSTVTWLKKYLSQTDIPSIIGSNTYFWKPSPNASGRRRNEKKRNDEIIRFFVKENFILVNE